MSDIINETKSRMQKSIKSLSRESLISVQEELIQIYKRRNS